MKDISYIKQLMELVKEYQIDELDVEGLIIKKSIHIHPEQVSNEEVNKNKEDDDILFWSTK